MRINCMCKQQKVVKGLKFGNIQNSINDVIRTGVIDVTSVEHLNNVPDSKNPQNDMKHDMLLESTEETVHQDEDDNESSDDISEADKVETCSPVKNIDMSLEPEPEKNSMAKMSVKNRADEDAHDHSDQDDSACITRSGRARNSHNYSKHFLDTAHIQTFTTDDSRLKPYYYEEVQMVEKLSNVIFYNESYFSEDVAKIKMKGADACVPIKRWDDQDQFQLYHEGLYYLNYNGDEIERLCSKSGQYSLQKGVKLFAEKEKLSATKEINNLAVKNDCFGEIDCKSLTQEMKDKELPLLMLMLMKSNGDIK